jgi:hypothetical protein
LRTVVWILAALAVLFVAYAVGRAVGILLGIGPHATEAAAVALVLLAIVWKAPRRADR